VVDGVVLLADDLAAVGRRDLVELRFITSGQM